MRLLRPLVAGAFLLSLLFAADAGAVTLQQVGSSFDKPIYVTSDPEDPDRLFVVEREGRIVLVQNGATSTFADLRSVIESEAGERGLLSIALAPSFSGTGLFYLDYTGKEEPGEIHVAEMRAVGNGASLTTLRNVLTIPHPEEDNHNGGQLQFGPEGHLYISTGDGGGGNDELHNAQDLTSLLGKILRINPRQSGIQPYMIPPGNPFPTALPSAARTIWSYGLRNPFRFSFDRLTGDITIGDVGQGEREEVDYAAAPGLGSGANYGWNCREGLIAGPADDPECATLSIGDFLDPVFEYPHSDPGGGAAHGCAIIGGYVVRDASLGDLYGRYLYGDFCTGQIRSLSLSGPLASDRYEGIQIANLNSFGEDSCGRLYAISGNGTVSRLVGATPSQCPVPAIADPLRPSFVGIRAIRRKVERGRRLPITAWVSPCKGRRGQRVQLLRGGRRVAAKRLDVACTVHFLPRIVRASTFRATVRQDATNAAGFSRRLKIKIQRHRPRQATRGLTAGRGRR